MSSGTGNVAIGPGHRGGLILGAVVTLLATMCIAQVWRCALIVPLEVPLNPNEGWNAYHAAAAMSGHGLYPAAGSFMINNYPPLSFYLVGLIGRMTGDFIVAGRVVSLAAFLADTLLIAAVARRLGCAWLEAAFAALLFADFLLLFTGYVGIDDPQLLAHVPQLAGLLVLLSGKGTRASDLAAAALFVLGLYVKHNLVALPLAVLAWLALAGWGRAVRLALAMGVIGGVGLLAFRLAFGRSLLGELVSARVLSLGHLRATFGVWLAMAGVMAAATAAVGMRGDRAARFCLIYALCSLVIGGFFVLGVGVSFNALFDANIAIALGSAVAVADLGGRGAVLRPLLAAVLAAPLVIGFAQLLGPRLADRDFWLQPMRREAAVAAADIGYLRSRPGPALCATPSLCYWAGKPEAVDVFNVEEQFRTAARPTGPLLELIDAHSFAVMQLERPMSFQPPVSTHILAGYRPDRVSANGAFFLPRSR